MNNIKYLKFGLFLIPEEDVKNHPLKTARGWIESYGTNVNTGTIYEIKTGLSILLGAGLIEPDDLYGEFKDVRKLETIGEIEGLVNVTQSDDMGGTADLGIKYKNKADIEYYSITKWTNTFNKCIHNGSATKDYGMSKSTNTEKNNIDAYNLAIAYRMLNFGPTPNSKWKRTPTCPGTKSMCEFLAKEASIKFNTFEDKKKIHIISNILDLDSQMKTNTKGIIYWDIKSNSIKGVYSWRFASNIHDFLETYSDGIYIYHGTPDKWLIRTQAKYNNGIIEGMSSKKNPIYWKPRMSTNYLSSWNSVVFSRGVFEMIGIVL
jgi:hypothetical protein